MGCDSNGMLNLKVAVAIHRRSATKATSGTASRWGWLLVFTLLLPGHCYGESNDPVEQLREQIERMTPSEREQLRHKKDLFYRLPKDQQTRLRQLHIDLQEAPDGAQLKKIMLRYSEWLQSLPSGKRAELVSLPPEQRIEQIRKILREEEEERFEQLAMQSLSPDDYRTILEWLNETVDRHRDEIVSRLSEEDRRHLEEMEDPQRRRWVMLSMIRRHGAGKSFIEQFPPNEEDLQRLAERVSDTAKKTLSEAKDPEAQRLIVRNWVRAATGIRGYRPVSHEKLQEFFREHLDPQQRDYLENLPREQMLYQLRRLYEIHRIRSSIGEPGKGRPGFGPPRRPGGFPRRPWSSQKDRDDEQAKPDAEERPPDPSR